MTRRPPSVISNWVWLAAAVVQLVATIYAQIIKPYDPLNPGKEVGLEWLNWLSGSFWIAAALVHSACYFGLSWQTSAASMFLFAGAVMFFLATCWSKDKDVGKLQAAVIVGAACFLAGASITFGTCTCQDPKLPYFIAPGAMCFALGALATLIAFTADSAGYKVLGVETKVVKIAASCALVAGGLYWAIPPLVALRKVAPPKKPLLSSSSKWDPSSVA